MIQGFAQKWTILGRRRAGALLFAICLNLAIIPCTMALEIVEQGHDCCPPEVQFEPSECCELDDVSVDARGDVLKLDDSPDLDMLSAPLYTQLLNLAPARYSAASDPPDPPGNSRPLYNLNCAYLI